MEYYRSQLGKWILQLCFLTWVYSLSQFKSHKVFLITIVLESTVSISIAEDVAKQTKVISFMVYNSSKMFLASQNNSVYPSNLCFLILIAEPFVSKSVSILRQKDLPKFTKDTVFKVLQRVIEQNLSDC